MKIFQNLLKQQSYYNSRKENIVYQFKKTFTYLNFEKKMVLVSNGHRWALIRYFVTVSNDQRITTAGKHIHTEKIVKKYKYIVVLQNC
jgi:hypothetical protein